MASSEVAYWRALELVDGPISSHRHDILNSILAATVANGHGARAKPDDFLPEWDTGMERVSGKQGMDMLAAFAKGHNTRLERTGG